MKSLRSTYLSEKKKVDASKRSGAAAENIYCSSLFYYDDFRFLDGAIVLRKSSSNFQQDTDLIEPIQQNPEQLNDDNHSQDLFDQFNEIHGDLTQSTLGRNAENDTFAASTPVKKTVRNGKRNKSTDEFNGELTQSTVDDTLTANTLIKKSERNTKRNKSSDVSSKYQAAIDAVIGMAKPCDTDESDMFTMFAKSLALQLKQMSMQNAITAMSEIQQLVSGHMLRSVCGHVGNSSMHVLPGNPSQSEHPNNHHQNVIVQHPVSLQQRQIAVQPSSFKVPSNQYNAPLNMSNEGVSNSSVRSVDSSKSVHPNNEHQNVIVQHPFQQPQTAVQPTSFHRSMSSTSNQINDPLDILNEDVSNSSVHSSNAFKSVDPNNNSYDVIEQNTFTFQHPQTAKIEQNIFYQSVPSTSKQTNVSLDASDTSDEDILNSQHQQFSQKGDIIQEALLLQSTSKTPILAFDMSDEDLMSLQQQQLSQKRDILQESLRNAGIYWNEDGELM